MSPALLLIAFLGGLLPALVWLFFWLLEDRCQPEPKRFIFLAFLCGAIGVLLVLPLERGAMVYFSGTMLIFVWAALEELFKFAAAYFGALRFSAYDEPLDAVMYTVTAALGFSAFENTLFLWSPLQQGDMARAVVTGDLRFMGATLLHILASATIGLALAMTYYKPGIVKKSAAILGVILATALHTVFNFFILQTGSGVTFWIFILLWFGIVALLLLIEHIKQPARDYC